MGGLIYETRQSFLQNFLPYFDEHYQNLSDQKESASIQYLSDLESENFPEVFRNNLAKDRALQRTTMGIHKDDFLFEINSHPLKKFGSQGQQKSYVIALKLAQFDSIKAQKNIKPLLLLDDIFDKLDDKRIQKLTEMVIHQSFGQLFVTDARPERTASIFEQVEARKKTFYIEAGIVVDMQEATS
jgi:DNA replication and repair protein RecF